MKSYRPYLGAQGAGNCCSEPLWSCTRQLDSNSDLSCESKPKYLFPTDRNLLIYQLWAFMVSCILGGTLKEPGNSVLDAVAAHRSRVSGSWHLSSQPIFCCTYTGPQGVFPPLSLHDGDIKSVCMFSGSVLYHLLVLFGHQRGRLSCPSPLDRWCGSPGWSHGVREGEELPEHRGSERRASFPWGGKASRGKAMGFKGIHPGLQHHKTFWRDSESCGICYYSECWGWRGGSRLCKSGERLLCKPSFYSNSPCLL